MNYLSWLGNHPFINQYDVLRHDQEDHAFFIKLQILLTDGSILHIKEYTNSNTRKYAFHWQQMDGLWLMRWDNVPHFPKLASFPHHSHDYRSGLEVVTDSFDISLMEVLDYIHRQFLTT